ncbi:hypothetical protein VTI74DRAFT_8124 [Chaetomium olivicolor]
MSYDGSLNEDQEPLQDEVRRLLKDDVRRTAYEADAQANKAHGPTAKQTARKLGHEVKEYVREKSISVMLRMSKSLRRRNEAERANPKRW